MTFHHFRYMLLVTQTIPSIIWEMTTWGVNSRGWRSLGAILEADTTAQPMNFSPSSCFEPPEAGLCGHISGLSGFWSDAANGEHRQGWSEVGVHIPLAPSLQAGCTFN